MKGIYIITGTSRGIGRAVAARLLETGHRVYGVSRTPSPLDGTHGFRAFQGSVTDTSVFEPLFEEVGALLDSEAFDFLCLLSNAAVLEPMKAIEHCTAEEIRQHVDVNLTAPIALTARFMAFFDERPLRKKVVHMTSGAATTPIPDMSLYCTVKAGISMFCECVGREQADRAHGFEIAAISPGMVETGMQQAMRAKSTEEFRPSEQFRAAKASGAVQDLDSVARRIADLLEARTDMGATVSVPGG